MQLFFRVVLGNKLIIKLLKLKTDRKISLALNFVIKIINYIFI